MDGAEKQPAKPAPDEALPQVQTCGSPRMDGASPIV